MPFRISLIAALAAFAAFAGMGLCLLPVASAQQKPAPAQGGNMQDRITQLEQRILDLQSVIATLQTFIKGGGAAQSPDGGLPPAAPGAAAGGGPSELSIRVLALETQIRALTGQVEQMNNRLNGGGGSSGAAALPQQAPPQLQSGSDFGAPPAPPQVTAPYGNVQPPAALQPSASVPQARPPWQADPNAQAPSPIPTPPPQTGQLPRVQGEPGSGARAAYDSSYQNFLRNDLQAAEQGFRSFVKTYPNDQLASNAYYWLGRTHFASRQFEPAAKAFLAGYKKDKKSAVAPDSLLHLGKSLAALGEKDAACSTLKAVAKQYPAAPGQVRQDVSAELKRAGC